MSYRVLRKEDTVENQDEPVGKTNETEVPRSEPENLAESVIEVKEPAIPLRQIVPEFIEIGDFQVRYVQPEPVPDFILFLQQLKHKDVVFVKIPVSSKVDKLYLIKPIKQLLGLTGVHWDKIDNLIRRYNAEETEADERERVRGALLAIVNLTIFITYEENVEFLRETD